MLTEQFIKQYLDPSSRVYSSFRAEAIRQASRVDVHAKGHWSPELMAVVRPNEEPQYGQYREDVFKSPTKKAFAKVENVISKIGKADDFQIIFGESPAQVATGEELETYTTVNFPVFDSVENWFFSFALNRMLRDANAVVAIYPETWPEQDREFFKPVLKVFLSEQVIDYRENEYCVLLDEQKSPVLVGKETRNEGDILHFIDRDQYRKLVQFGEKEENKYRIESEYTHDIRYMPAFKIGGTIEDFDGTTAFYHSFIEPCLDDWDEAVRRYSDHQVNMIINLHPDRWEVVTQECKRCNAKGVVRGVDDDGKKYESSCKACSGSGYIRNKSPFGVTLINPVVQASMDNALTIPTPPTGNAARDITSITTLKDEYKSKIVDGLSAINMEFLADVLLAQSGVAKSMDRDELNSFLYKVARHAADNVLKPAFYFISKWRYAFLPEKEIDAMQPKIRVPKSFDIITTAIAAERATNAKTAGYSPSLVSQLELTYAASEFGDESASFKFCKAMLELDPLVGRSIDEKMALSASNVITKINFIISDNLSEFLRQAIEADVAFLDKPYSEQKKVIEKMGTDLEAQINAANVSVFDQVGDSGNKLAQTASALDSMIKMSAAIKKGELDYDSAVALVSNRFGITEEQARRELGTKPTSIQPPAAPPVIPQANGAAAAA